MYDEDVKIGGPGTRNIKSPTQLKTLIDDLQSFSSNQNLLISVDQEGGTVHRLKSIYGFPETPAWQHIGLLKNKLITKQNSTTKFVEYCSPILLLVCINLYISW